jgi:hypothetical protein
MINLHYVRNRIFIEKVVKIAAEIIRSIELHFGPQTKVYLAAKPVQNK